MIYIRFKIKSKTENLLKSYLKDFEIKLSSLFYRYW